MCLSFHFVSIWINNYFHDTVPAFYSNVESIKFRCIIISSIATFSEARTIFKIFKQRRQCLSFKYFLSSGERSDFLEFRRFELCTSTFLFLLTLSSRGEYVLIKYNGSLI